MISYFIETSDEVGAFPGLSSVSPKHPRLSKEILSVPSNGVALGILSPWSHTRSIDC